jgi:hypothetical protein
LSIKKISALYSLKSLDKEFWGYRMWKVYLKIFLMYCLWYREMIIPISILFWRFINILNKNIHFCSIICLFTELSKGYELYNFTTDTEFLKLKHFGSYWNKCWNLLYGHCGNTRSGNSLTIKMLCCMYTKLQVQINI